jgi:transaldolase
VLLASAAAIDYTPPGIDSGQHRFMKFFIDTADINEIRDLAATGLVDGVTTNPSLVAKTGKSFLDVIKEICAVVPGPVSAEVTATDHKTMLAEGRKLAKLAPNVAVKVPLTPDGLKTCKALADEGTKVNVTLCFSAAQAILAAKAGAAFISPFVGRLDDIGTDGMGLISDIVQIYDAYPAFTTEVLVASVRHPIHVIESAKMGAHVATLPPNVLRQMFNHPLTDKGLTAFLADWAKTGQSIL